MAQDIIYKKDGTEIKAKVLEVGIDTIKYKIIETLENPPISISKTEVFMIKYENGTKDIINTITPETAKSGFQQ